MPYDVIARTPSFNELDDRIAIRRNLVVAGDTTVTPQIDVAAEGTATVFAQATRTDGDDTITSFHGEDITP